LLARTASASCFGQDGIGSHVDRSLRRVLHRREQPPVRLGQSGVAAHLEDCCGRELGRVLLASLVTVGWIVEYQYREAILI
jgi:hypothetical protein